MRGWLAPPAAGREAPPGSALSCRFVEGRADYLHREVPEADCDEVFFPILKGYNRQLDEEVTMQTHSAKQEALEAIARLPDSVNTEEIMYRLYVLENIRRGQQDAEQGKTTQAEQLLRDIQTW